MQDQDKDEIYMMLYSLQTAIKQLGQDIQNHHNTQQRDSKDLWTYIKALDTHLRK